MRQETNTEVEEEDVDAEATVETEVETEVDAEVDADAEIPESFPEYVTKADHDALNSKLDQIITGLAAGQQRAEPAAARPEPKPADTRSPYEVAIEEAERQGIVREDWIQSRAMQIQEERITDRLMGTLAPLLAPVLESHALSQVTGGDAALNAEVQTMIQQGVVNAQALQDPNVKTVVLDAARFRLAQKEEGAGGGNAGTARKLPGAAPTRTVLGANSGGGVRAQLTPAQRADLKEKEAKFGQYTNEEIQESYFQ